MTKNTQAEMVFPVEKIYEVSFTTVSFAIGFSERVNEILWLKICKNLGSFEFNLKKKHS